MEMTSALGHSSVFRMLTGNLQPSVTADNPSDIKLTADEVRVAVVVSIADVAVVIGVEFVVIVAL